MNPSLSFAASATAAKEEGGLVSVDMIGMEIDGRGVMCVGRVPPGKDWMPAETPVETLEMAPDGAPVIPPDMSDEVANAPITPPEDAPKEASEAALDDAPKDGLDVAPELTLDAAPKAPAEIAPDNASADADDAAEDAPDDVADDATDDVADAAADDVADDAVDDGADDAPDNTPADASFGIPTNRLPVNTPAGAPHRVESSAAKENADV